MYKYINIILNQTRLISQSVYYKISTIYGRIFVRLKGIALGKGVVFRGNTYFTRATLGDISIGSNCTFNSASKSNLIGINRPCIITANPNSKIIIGNNCGFSGVVIGCFSKIEIEDNVRVGANVTITDGDWHLNDYRSSKPRPILIKNNVWLGVNVTVLKGVTIGENSVIGANSVVTKDVPSNVIAAGNPCEIIKSIS